MYKCMENSYSLVFRSLEFIEKNFAAPHCPVTKYAWKPLQ